jgi:hypothetical protein
MRICIRLVKVISRERVGFARVDATGVRLVRGESAARITLLVRFRVRLGEPDTITRQRARDTALKYLDIS